MPEFDLYLLGYGLLVGLFAGAMGGMLAGLAGLGGGLIYVPVFYALMPEGPGAVSTPVMASMGAIVFTGFFSARVHWRLGHVDMNSFKQLVPGLILGAALGLWLTHVRCGDGCCCGGYQSTAGSGLAYGSWTSKLIFGRGMAGHSADYTTCYALERIVACHVYRRNNTAVTEGAVLCAFGWNVYRRFVEYAGLI